jgi:hypothetical protein
MHVRHVAVDLQVAKARNSAEAEIKRTADLLEYTAEEGVLCSGA